YDAGFDERARNPQVDNYGRGGIGNDPILAESQDYEGSDNANAETPSDGQSPRIQMYLWHPVEGRVIVQPPSGDHTVEGALRRANDAGAATHTGCGALANGDDARDQIVLVDGDGCDANAKATALLRLGARGMILIAATSAFGNSDPSLATFPALALDPSV